MTDQEETIARLTKALEYYAGLADPLDAPNKEYPFRYMREFGCASGTEGVWSIDYAGGAEGRDWEIDMYDPVGLTARIALGRLSERDKIDLWALQLAGIKVWGLPGSDE